MARLHELARLANKGDDGAAIALKSSAAVMGLLGQSGDAWAKGEIKELSANMPSSSTMSVKPEDSNNEIDAKIKARSDARNRRDFVEADRIRDELAADGIHLEDSADGTIWRRG
jgi:cysteinyl-tRNA synthetase